MQGVCEIVYFSRLKLITIFQIRLQAAVACLHIKVAQVRELEKIFSIQRRCIFTVVIVQNCPVS